MIRAGKLARSRWAWEAAVVLFSALYMVVFAWPASIQPAAWVWGSHGDGLGNIVEFSWFVQAIQHGWSWNVDPNLAIPFGEDLGSLPHEPIYFWTQVGLGLVAGSVVALNLISMIAVPAAAWTMFRLVLWITRSPVAGFVSGIGFGCCSYLLINTRGEPTLAQVWIFPAVVLALLKMARRPGLGSAAVVAITLTVAALVNFYYVLFVALASVALMAGWLGFTAVERRAVPIRALLTGLAAGAAGVVATLSLYQVLVGHLSERAARIHRTAASLAALAPSPLDIVLPPRSNPWLGFWRQQLFETRLARTGAYTDFGELSTSASILLLAVAGAVALVLLRRRFGLIREGILLGADVAGIAGIILVGAWLLVPPFWLRHRLWFLSLQWDIFSIAPQYASFYRAGILIVFGACVLAGIAVAALALRRPRAAAAVALLAAAVVFGENFMLPSDRVLAVQAPPEYAWLSDHPGSYAIADYPLLPTNSGANEYTPEFYQRFHGHPLLNGHINGTQSESMREEMRDPNRPGVAGALAALGVRYIVWHDDLISSIAPLLPAYARQLYGYLPRSPGYTLEDSFPDGSSVFAVVAPPVHAFAFYAAGFGPAVNDDAGAWLRHTNMSDGQLGVYLAAGTEHLTLRFDCESRDAPMTLVAGGSLTTLLPGQSTPVTVSIDAHHGVNVADIRFTPESAALRGSAMCGQVTAVP